MKKGKQFREDIVSHMMFTLGLTHEVTFYILELHRYY